MSIALPREAEKYVDPDSSINSLRSLVEAAAEGKIDLSVVAGYARIAAKGDKPSFKVTASIPVSMIKAIEAHPEKSPRQVVYGPGLDTLWTWEDAEKWELNASALHDARMRSKKTVKERGVYRTRNLLPRTPRPKTNNMFTAKVNHEALSRPGLSDGARQCLLWLVTLAGKNDTLTTYTSSLATLMERTPRTVRNYFIALEEADLISRRPGTHYNTVHIELHPDCRPAKYEEPRDVKAFKIARKSPNPALHLMAMSVVMASMDVHRDEFATQDRRKEITVFNQESNVLMRRMVDKPALPSVDGVMKQARSGGMTPPTSHSTLLLDPTKPINGRRSMTGRGNWAKPTGFNHLAVF